MVESHQDILQRATLIAAYLANIVNSDPKTAQLCKAWTSAPSWEEMMKGVEDNKKHEIEEYLKELIRSNLIMPKVS